MRTATKSCSRTEGLSRWFWDPVLRKQRRTERHRQRWTLDDPPKAEGSPPPEWKQQLHFPHDDHPVEKNRHYLNFIFVQLKVLE